MSPSNPYQQTAVERIASRILKKYPKQPELDIARNVVDIVYQELVKANDRVEKKEPKRAVTD